MTAQLTPAEIDTIVNRIVMVARPDRVLMFGSYAKGVATDRSDLDLLVVVPTDTTPLCQPSDLTPYLGGWIIPIDIHVVTTEELEEYGKEQYHFLHSVLQSGRTLYQRIELRHEFKTNGPTQIR
ncbi:nucleotidyltransferase domain-containing protein [Streptosporangiaceae bacterium NEAU-GS5]|nr:nucleotidyltransferase domain-containing protein [Streptosporangiaceae bacterium NEAU-GS5]